MNFKHIKFLEFFQLLTCLPISKFFHNSLKYCLHQFLFYSFLGFHFRERLKRASGQVRFLSSLRSRATAISSIKKKRHSSSNSAGSIRAHPNCQHHSHINKAHLLPNRPETPRGSIVQKTERTVI